MSYNTDIERLNYYEGEYLGAVDFEAEQEYHRDMRRRHNVGQHTWGIVTGLDLAQIPNGVQSAGGQPEVDVYIMPGMAIDAFGREIVVLSRTQLTRELFAAFYNPNANANPQYMSVWVAYQQQFLQPSQDPCASQNTSNPFGRVQESYRIAVTLPSTPPHNDPLVVDGNSMVPPAEPSSTTPAPTPNPGDIVLPYDGSVPYQEFPTDDTTVNWFIPIGRVMWDPHNEVFLQIDPGSAASGRLYAGNVSANVYAPAGSLTIQDRFAPFPLSNDQKDAHYNGVSMEVAGGLQVDRLLNPLTYVLIGSLYNPSDTTALSPLTIAASGADNNQELIQFRNPSGQETWHICQNLSGNNPGINIGEVTPQGSFIDARLFIQSTLTTQAPSTQNVGIGTLTPRNPLAVRGQGAWEELLSFEDSSGNTKWHLNRNPQGTPPPGTPSYTPGLNFCETGVADFRLFLQAGGNVGVGTPLPQQNLSVNGGLNIDQASRNGGSITPGLTFGSTSGEGIASDRVGGTGSNQYGLDFYTNFTTRMSITQQGQVGIGTTNPSLPLDIQGDFGRQNGPATLHLWASQIGDVGNGILFLRSGGKIVAFDGNDNVVGIGTNNPNLGEKLHVLGNVRLEQPGKVLRLRTDGAAVDVQSDSSDLWIHSPIGNNVLINPTGGKVGIGTTSPSLLLDIQGDFGRQDNAATLHLWGSQVGDVGNGILFLRSGGNVVAFDGNDSVGIGTTQPNATLDVRGDVLALNFPSGSDQRFKTNIMPLTAVLERLNKVRGVSFEWNEVYAPPGYPRDKRQIGVLAQEVEAVFPELVRTYGDKDYKALDYGRLAVVLLEAVKELASQVEGLHQKIDAFQNAKDGPAKPHEKSPHKKA